MNEKAPREVRDVIHELFASRGGWRDRAEAAAAEANRLRTRLSRLEGTLQTIRDTEQTASGARLLATHALQDGHTEMRTTEAPNQEKP